MDAFKELESEITRVRGRMEQCRSRHAALEFDLRTVEMKLRGAEQALKKGDMLEVLERLEQLKEVKL